MGVCVAKPAKPVAVAEPEIKLGLPKPKINLLGSILDLKKVKKAPMLSLEQSPLYQKRLGPGSPSSPDTETPGSLGRSGEFVPEDN
jgi:hypothetical protein